MIDVWVTHEDGDYDYLLMEWPATEVGNVIPTLRSWGIRFQSDTLDIPAWKDMELTGEFFVDEGGTGFLVTIHDA
jgi:hypothetical protein